MASSSTECAKRHRSPCLHGLPLCTLLHILVHFLLWRLGFSSTTCQLSSVGTELSSTGTATIFWCFFSITGSRVTFVGAIKVNNSSNSSKSSWTFSSLARAFSSLMRAFSSLTRTSSFLMRASSSSRCWWIFNCLSMIETRCSSSSCCSCCSRWMPSSVSSTCSITYSSLTILDAGLLFTPTVLNCSARSASSLRFLSFDSLRRIERRVFMTASSVCLFFLPLPPPLRRCPNGSLLPEILRPEIFFSTGFLFLSSSSWRFPSSFKSRSL